MQNPIESFGEAVRIERARKRMTQKELADLLHLSERTIMDVELGRTNSRLETIAIIAKGLNISLDAIMFPDAPKDSVPKNVMDFFIGKSESEVQKYISICKCIESLMSETGKK